MTIPTLREVALACGVLAAAILPAQARDTQAAVELIQTDDGYQLPLWSWVPATAPAAVIVALHGFRDYGGSFEQPAIAWRDGGVATYAFDLRGFGATASAGHWAGTDVLFADTAHVVKLAGERHPGRPIYLVGESLGSSVLLANAGHLDLPGVRGVVLLGSGVLGWQAMPAFAGTLLKTVARKLPDLRAPAGGPFGLATDNRAAIEAADRDPLVLRDVRFEMLAGVIDAMDAALTHAGELTVPAFVAYGAHDRVIPAWARREFLHRIGTDADVRSYPNGYHMLLRDLGAQVVIDDILAWVLQAR